MKRDLTHNIKAKECNRKISDDIEEVIQNKFGKRHDIIWLSKNQILGENAFYVSISNLQSHFKNVYFVLYHFYFSIISYYKLDT